jgi:hypothetical protein
MNKQLSVLKHHEGHGLPLYGGGIFFAERGGG